VILDFGLGILDWGFGNLDFGFWILDWGFNKWDKGRKTGADDYFIKPFSPLGLIRKVEEIFE
jgi:hypothetical protein